MKYYSQPPSFLSYLIVPLIGAVPVGAIVITISEAICGYDFEPIVNAFIMAALFILILVWLIRVNRFRVYVELSPHAISMGSEKPGCEPDVVLDLQDIKTLEIVCMINNLENVWYLVHDKDERRHGFDAEVPEQDVVHFCRSNNTTMLRTTYNYFNVYDVTLGRNRMVIVYQGNKWINPSLWPKKRIRYSNVERMELVIPHPISTTGNHYIVFTKTGEQYQFLQHEIERDKLEKRALASGFSVVERKLYP